jgi:hypothetical protein
MTTNRIDPTPVRMSTNLSIDRQTPKTDFGDRVNAGLSAAGNAVSSGLGVVAPMLPGGPILSAAVSSVGTVAGGSSAGQSVGGAYAGLGSGAVGVGGSLSTTIGGTGLPTGGSTGGVSTGGGVSMGGGGSGASANMPISATDPGAGGAFSVQDMAAQQGRLLNLQIAMQNENQVWSTVSNVLKVRHDTVKNTIQNVH